MAPNFVVEEDVPNFTVVGGKRKNKTSISINFYFVCLFIYISLKNNLPDNREILFAVCEKRYYEQNDLDRLGKFTTHSFF